MDNNSFIANIEESIREHWDRPALTNYKQSPITYREVGEKIARLHILYSQCGIEKGDHIAICGRNCAEWAISFFSILTYGAVAVPLLHEFKPQNVEHLVNHANCKLLMVGDVVWEGIDADNLPEVHAIIQQQEWKLVYCQDRKYQEAYDNLDKAFQKKYPNFNINQASGLIKIVSQRLTYLIFFGVKFLQVGRSSIFTVNLSLYSAYLAYKFFALSSIDSTSSVII